MIYVDEPNWSQCGALFRHEMEERKGPRGGRRTAVRVICMRCERTTDWIVSKRPGSFDDEKAALVAELRGLDCKNPHVPSREERMLIELGKLIGAEETVSLRFAADFLESGQPIGEAALKAWNECEDAYAMGTFITAYSHRPSSRRMGMVRRLDDGRVHVDVYMQRGTLHLSVTGFSEHVAVVLQNAIPADAVRKMAELVWPK